MASSIIIISINYSTALRSETKVLPDSGSQVIFSYLINAVQLYAAFDRCKSFLFHYFYSLQLFFPPDNFSLGNSHFFQVAHFQQKLLKVELWPSKSWGRKAQLEIIWQRSFQLLSLWYYLLFCWPPQREKADSAAERRGAAATPLFHLRAQVPVSAEHFNQLNATDTACCYEPRSNSKRPPDAGQAFGQTSAANECYEGWRCRNKEDEGQETCRHHSDSLSAQPCWFLSPIFTRAAQHITSEMWVMDLCLVQRFIPLCF